jgi:hypothetical protein
MKNSHSKKNGVAPESGDLAESCDESVASPTVRRTTAGFADTRLAVRTGDASKMRDLQVYANYVYAYLD